MTLLRGLERVPAFLPITNPPFADNSPRYYEWGIYYGMVCVVKIASR